VAATVAPAGDAAPSSTMLVIRRLPVGTAADGRPATSDGRGNLLEQACCPWPGGACCSTHGEGATLTSFDLDSLFGVRDKVVVVTGGSRGIGEMIAAGFLANGARTYISSRKADACDETAARLAAEHGGTCVSIPANLAELDGIHHFVEQLRSHEDHVDVLVNNAGVSWGAPIDEFPENGWDKVMDTNVKGVFFLTQGLLPLLEKAATADDPARVINIGSVDGIKTPRFDNYS
jgi:hypothetical protein